MKNFLKLFSIVSFCMSGIAACMDKPLHTYIPEWDNTTIHHLKLKISSKSCVILDMHKMNPDFAENAHIELLPTIEDGKPFSPQCGVIAELMFCTPEDLPDSVKKKVANALEMESANVYALFSVFDQWRPYLTTDSVYKIAKICLHHLEEKYDLNKVVFPDQECKTNVVCMRDISFDEDKDKGIGYITDEGEEFTDINKRDLLHQLHEFFTIYCNKAEDTTIYTSFISPVQTHKAKNRKTFKQDHFTRGGKIEGEACDCLTDLKCVVNDKTYIFDGNNQHYHRMIDIWSQENGCIKYNKLKSIIGSIVRGNAIVEVGEKDATDNAFDPCGDDVGCDGEESDTLTQEDLDFIKQHNARFGYTQNDNQEEDGTLDQDSTLDKMFAPVTISTNYAHVYQHFVAKDEGVVQFKRSCIMHGRLIITK